MKKRELKKQLAEQAARIVELEAQVAMLQQLLEWERQSKRLMPSPIPQWIPYTAPSTKPWYEPPYDITTCGHDVVGISTTGEL